MKRVPHSAVAVLLAAAVLLAPAIRTDSPGRAFSAVHVVQAASGACAATGVPTAYTGTWRGISAKGEINLHLRTHSGGGIVDEDIGHEATAFQFTMDGHGQVTKSKGKALYHFNVTSHSVALPDQVSARAYLKGGVQERPFTIAGQVCPDGKMQLASTGVPDLVLFDGRADTKIGAWNVFPPEAAQVTVENKRLHVRDITLVKKLAMHMSWSASKCITFAFLEHRSWTGNTTVREDGVDAYYAVPVTSTFLITDTNPEVIFKSDQPQTPLADRDPHVHNMQAPVAERLGMLAQLVEAEWPREGPGGKPVKVRVTAAWAPVGSHHDNSRHYSGRALDLTTFPPDGAKLGCLAGLAYEAGFDWVFYEDHLHVHVSMQS